MLKQCEQCEQLKDIEEFSSTKTRCNKCSDKIKPLSLRQQEKQERQLDKKYPFSAELGKIDSVVYDPQKSLPEGWIIAKPQTPFDILGDQYITYIVWRIVVKHVKSKRCFAVYSVCEIVDADECAGDRGAPYEEDFLAGCQYGDCWLTPEDDPEKFAEEFGFESMGMMVDEVKPFRTTDYKIKERKVPCRK
jgi:hypothetical protein